MKSIFKFIFTLCFVLTGTLVSFSAPENHEEFARQYMPESQAIFERFRKDCGETKLLRDSLATDLKVMNRVFGDDAAYCALVLKIKELEMQENAWAKLLKDCYFKHKGGLFTDEQLSEKDVALAKEKLAWEEKELKSMLKNEVVFFGVPKLVKIPGRVWSIGKYEVTQKEYQAVMGVNPSHFKGDENRPVENVSWYDAQAFCKKLTERERAAGRLPAGYKYTLPTSKQWEIACRAGTTTKYCSGNTEADLSRVAWWKVNSGDKTHPVGTKEPNAWGIHDMHGNVQEWCLESWYLDSGSRACRGGYYGCDDYDCKSSYVDKAYKYACGTHLGFRVVLFP